LNNIVFQLFSMKTLISMNLKTILCTMIYNVFAGIQNRTGIMLLRLAFLTPVLFCKPVYLKDMHARPTGVPGPGPAGGRWRSEQPKKKKNHRRCGFDGGGGGSSLKLLRLEKAACRNHSSATTSDDT
jgi:hypothetical protein